MPKVSIIVPVYNAEKYLHKCFDSLVGQTLQEIEIIAVNDGSTDGSLRILEEYQAIYPGKIKVFTKENGGQASARNLAIAHAVGDYIGFVDADDYADIHMFEALSQRADETGADLIVCDHYKVKGKQEKYVAFPTYSQPKDMLRGVLVSPWNKLIKRTTLYESGVVFPEGYIYEDTAWFAELIPFIKTMAYVHEPLLYHVVQENSTMTAAQGERTAQIFPVMNGVVDFYREKGLIEEYHDELECFYTRILLFSSMRRISKIADKTLRHTLVQRTLVELEEHFPEFREIHFIKGWKRQYIKRASSYTLRLATTLFRLFAMSE